MNYKCFALTDNEYVVLNFITYFYVKDKNLYISTVLPNTNLVIKYDSEWEAKEIAGRLSEQINSLK